MQRQRARRVLVRLSRRALGGRGDGRRLSLRLGWLHTSRGRRLLLLLLLLTLPGLVPGLEGG